MGIFDKLLNSLNSKSQLRIAVTGTTSSGKSYLLRDIITALELYGTIGGGKRSNPLCSTISQLKRQLMSIEKTAMFPARQYDIYADCVNFGGKTVEVMLADIPGECFTAANLDMFRSIYEALLNCKESIFGLRKWRRGDSVKTTVFARGGAYSPAGETIGDSDSYAASSRNRYIDNANVLNELARTGYQPEDKEVTVDGEELLKRFWQLEIDTVINAIDAAWDMIGVNDVLTRNHVTLNKSTFTGTAARLAFVPLFYAVTATDIVVSDLMASPGRSLSGKALDRAKDANADFSTMTQTLGQLNDITGQPRNWYLALKGVDSIINSDSLGKVYNDGGRDSNFAYSWMTLAFARHYLRHEVKFDSDDDFHYTLSSDTRLVDVRHDDNGNEVEVARLRRNYTYSGNYFLKPGSYVVMSYEIPDDGSQPRPLPLKKHIELRDREFRSLTRYSSSGDGCAAIGLAPHTFLVAHPIDVEFKVYGKSDDTHFTSDWNTAVPLAFGTTQLLADILLQHGINPGCNYGNLLSYFFGNK